MNIRRGAPNVTPENRPAPGPIQPMNFKRALALLFLASMTGALAAAPTFADISSGSNGFSPAGSGSDPGPGLGTRNLAPLVLYENAVTAPAITIQPLGGQAVVGASITLTVAATGTAVQYQWDHDDVAIPGANQATLTLVNLRESDGGNYSVAVTNAAGRAGSTAARITVVPRPVLTPPSTLTISTLAGVPPGASDGTGSTARFWNPQGVAVDGAGNLYVADTNNYTIRKISPAGVVSTLAGMAGAPGGVDGTGSSARLGPVHGIAADDSGNLFVTDLNGVRKITPAGAVTTVVGPLSGAFVSTDGVAVDGAGNLYVCDRGAEKIAKITPAGVISTLAGGTHGSADGTGASAQFNFPFGVAVDRAGNVYVADQENCTIRKITPAGVVTTLAGAAGNAGMADGPGSAARFWYPQGVAVDAAGNVFVADWGASLIRKITPEGLVSTVAGQTGVQGNTDGIGTAALFNQPRGLAVDQAGNVYVADTGSSTVRAITPTGAVRTVAGLASVGSSDGTGPTARFQKPFGIAVDGLGTLYVADQLNNTIRKITAAGAVRTLAGIVDGRVGYANGPGVVARFWWPFSLTVDGAGNVFVADKMNNVIRKVTAEGVASLFAGKPFGPASGILAVGDQNPGGSADGPALSAEFYGPAGVAVDGAGNVYVADQQNATIRKVSSTGTVTTLAGAAGAIGNADGPGAAARFNMPTGITVDGAGNLFVADQENCTIRKITPAGIVTTVAGLAGSAGSTDGVGTAARFNRPTSVAVDSANNLYVADYVNDTIRLITPSGNVTTLAGFAGINGLGHGEWSSPGFADGVGALARFDSPSAVAVDDFGNVYIVDRENNTVRKGFPGVSAPPPAPTAGGATTVTYDGFGANWTAVAGAQGYRLDVSRTSDFSDYAPGYENLDVGTTRTLFVGGLAANTTYYYRVRAYNAGSTSGNSATITVTTASLPPSPAYAPLAVTTLAGQVGGTGAADGSGTAARFNSPTAVAVDATGSVYLADTDNHTIRKFVPSTGAVSTLAGLAGVSGSDDGTGSAARFDQPAGTAVDGAGNVYVADTLNHTIRRITAGGVVTTVAGLAGSGGSVDGAGSLARFCGPQGLAVDAQGRLYVADTNNDTIRRIDLSSGAVTTIAGSPGQPGAVNAFGSAARLNAPSGIAVNAAGVLFIADTDNHAIRVFDPIDGGVGTLAGSEGRSGSTDGTRGSARFCYPSDVTVTATGIVYVADTNNHTIRSIDPATGIVTTVAGQAVSNGSSDGIGAAVRFFAPTGLAADHTGNIYIVDTDNQTLRVGLPSAAPAIQTQPQSQTVDAGSTARFSVVASGQPSPTYQWSLNGAAIAGATGSTFTVSNAQPGNAGDYTVTISNALGSVTSNRASLTVSSASAPPPSGGSGGGAMEAWFVAGLALLAAWPALRTRAATSARRRR